jgi:hypothetical protein
VIVGLGHDVWTFAVVPDGLRRVLGPGHLCVPPWSQLTVSVSPQLGLTPLLCPPGCDVASLSSVVIVVWDPADPASAVPGMSESAAVGSSGGTKCRVTPGWGDDQGRTRSWGDIEWRTGSDHRGATQERTLPPAGLRPPKIETLMWPVGPGGMSSEAKRSWQTVVPALRSPRVAVAGPQEIAVNGNPP